MKKRFINICLCLSVAFVLCCSFFTHNVKYNNSYALTIQDNVTFTFNEVSSTMQPYYFVNEYYDYDENSDEVAIPVTPNFYDFNTLYSDYFPNSDPERIPSNVSLSFTPRLTVEGSSLTLDLLNLSAVYNMWENMLFLSYNSFYYFNYASDNSNNYDYYWNSTYAVVRLYDINYNQIGYANLSYNRNTHAVNITSYQTGYSNVTGLNYPRFRFDSSTFSGLISNYYISFEFIDDIYFYTSSDYENYFRACAYSYLSFSKAVDDISIDTFGNFDTSFYEYYKRTGVEGSNYYKEDMWKFRGDNSNSNITFSFPSLYNLGTSQTIYDVFDNSNANYNDGYDDGYKNGKNVGYNSGYSEGRSEGYDYGFDQGDAAGFSRGVAESNNYSFLGLISAVIDAPVRAFTGLLNFDVLGVNLSGFLLGLFSIALVLFIYRKIKGW